MPCPSTATSVTSARPIISAAAVEAVRCGFRRRVVPPELRTGTRPGRTPGNSAGHSGRQEVTVRRSHIASTTTKRPGLRMAPPTKARTRLPARDRVPKRRTAASQKRQQPQRPDDRGENDQGTRRHRADVDASADTRFDANSATPKKTRMCAEADRGGPSAVPVGGEESEEDAPRIRDGEEDRRPGARKRATGMAAVWRPHEPRRSGALLSRGRRAKARDRVTRTPTSRATTIVSSLEEQAGVWEA